MIQYRLHACIKRVKKGFLNHGRSTSAPSRFHMRIQGPITAAKTQSAVPQRRGQRPARAAPCGNLIYRETKCDENKTMESVKGRKKVDGSPKTIHKGYFFFSLFIINIHPVHIHQTFHTAGTHTLTQPSDSIIAWRDGRHVFPFWGVIVFVSNKTNMRRFPAPIVHSCMPLLKENGAKSNGGSERWHTS